MASYQQFKDWHNKHNYIITYAYQDKFINAWIDFCKAKKIKPKIDEPKISWGGLNLQENHKAANKYP